MDEWERRMDTMMPLPRQWVTQRPDHRERLEGDDIDILKFPTPKWHEEDGGRYIGTGCFDITRDPDDGWVNLGTYRVMVHDREPPRAATSRRASTAASTATSTSRAASRCRSAMVVGARPAAVPGQHLEIRYGVSEYDWVGGMRGEPLRVIRGSTPACRSRRTPRSSSRASCSPTTKRLEGPFGEWTGYYASAAREEPVFDSQGDLPPQQPDHAGLPAREAAIRGAPLPRSTCVGADLRRELEQAGVPDVAAPGATASAAAGC